MDKTTLLDKAGQQMLAQNYQQRKQKVMRQVLELYLAGKTLPAIAEALSVAKGTVSLHLNTVEEITGCVVLRRPNKGGSLGAVVVESEDQRLKRGSIRGWHSFRTSFVTRALNAGMSEELVRRVTGHTTVDIVREHYHNPDREDFRKEFERVAPKLYKTLQSNEVTVGGTLVALLESMEPSTWEQKRSELITLIRKEQTLW